MKKIAEQELLRMQNLQKSVVTDAISKRRKQKANDLEINNRDRYRNNIRQKLKFTKKKKNLIVGPHKILQQIDLQQDGLYFVIFILSIGADIVTFIIGMAEAIPIVGGLIAGVAETQIIGWMAVIGLLYIMNGHYKKRKAIIKIAVTLGFDFMELIPMAAVLPGFIGSFLINYGIVLYGRAIEVNNKQKTIIDNNKTKEIF